MVQHRIFWKKSGSLLFSSLIILCVLFTAACSSGSSSPSSHVTITLSAPNQFTTSSSDFGPAWSTIISEYEKLHSNVTVNINVLPLTSFNQTLSTELVAGTAPDLVFNQLKWAVDFLQFMTAPKYNQPWVTTTTSLPSVDTVQAPSTVAGFSQGAWGQTPKSNGYALTQLDNQQAQEFPQIMQGLLLGKNSLSQTEQALEASWQQAATANIQSNNWSNESWAQ